MRPDVPGKSDVRFWRDDDLGGLELRFSSYQSVCFGRHTHDTYSVALVEGGRSKAFLGGRQVAVTAGDIVLVHPDEVHACNPVRGSGWRYWMLHLDPKWFRDLALEVAGRDEGSPRFQGSVARDAVVEHALVRLIALVSGGAGRLEKEVAALAALGPLVVRHTRLHEAARGPEVRRAVRRVQEYIDAHLEHNVSLSALGRVAGLSPYHLVRVFRETTGLPPHAWHNQRRIQRARRLLSAGVPIAEVALDAGFADQSHFSHRFRESVGTTPRRYRCAGEHVSAHTVTAISNKTRVG